jgi:SAM-dependent methyltransferase
MPSRSSREQFDQQAAHYNSQWNAWSGDSLAWLIAHAHSQASHKLLDVATGTGFTALAFAPLLAEVTGVDVSVGMLREARERSRAAGLANLNFCAGAAESLPFPAARFDRVACRVAPHHFLSVPRFVAEVHRVLRPGGRLLVADTSVPDHAPAADAWQNRVESLRDGSHVRNYTPSEWRGFIAAAGLALEEVDQVNEAVLVSMRAWIEKSGCHGETAAEVRRLFLEAPAEAVRAFSIARLPDGDIGFQWVRVALSARKPA